MTDTSQDIDWVATFEELNLAVLSEAGLRRNVERTQAALGAARQAFIAAEQELESNRLVRANRSARLLRDHHITIVQATAFIMTDQDASRHSQKRVFKPADADLSECTGVIESTGDVSKESYHQGFALLVKILSAPDETMVGQEYGFLPTESKIVVGDWYRE